MKIEKIETFHVIGIEVRTTNENGQAMQDIPALWQRFFAQEIRSQITNISSDELYCIYTNYETDHTKPYSTILGCRVESLDRIPEGLTGTTIHGADYNVLTAKGKTSDPFVYEAWQTIWNLEMNRAYITDFEVYGAKSQNQEAAEVDIYIGLK